jgi:crotonobetainyl-CoA:carnitine CoA-transferase CaiB-like acyl-CoA transferase
VEKMPGGDDTRAWREPSVRGESAAFIAMNRNKRSIAVNLKHEQGKAVLRRLLAKEDVVTENFRKGALDRLGFGYADVREINPSIIYCSISGYGRTGPYADKGGFDLIAQGFTGLMSITGESGGSPAKAGSPIADISAGILAALGIVAAHVHRLKSGQGQLVDTSLMEAGVQQTYWQAAMYFATGLSPGPVGSAHLLTAPYQAFPVKDGWINLGGANQSNWKRITAIIGAPELAHDHRFTTNADRMENLPALAAEITSRLRHRTAAEWIEAFDTAGVPVGPINTVGDALSDPQVLARDMVVEVDHPRTGRTRVLGCPIKFSETAAGVRRPAPLFGEQTGEVLEEHGYTKAEIDALVAAGAVGVPAPEVEYQA